MEELAKFLNTHILQVWGILLVVSLMSSKLIARSFSRGWAITLLLIPLAFLASVIWGSILSIALTLYFVGWRVVALALNDPAAFVAYNLEMGLEYSAVPALVSSLAFIWYRAGIKKKPDSDETGADALAKGNERPNPYFRWALPMTLVCVVLVSAITAFAYVQEGARATQGHVELKLERFDERVVDPNLSSEIQRYLKRKAAYKSIALVALQSPASHPKVFSDLRMHFPSQVSLTESAFISFIRDEVQEEFEYRIRELRTSREYVLARGLLSAAALFVLILSHHAAAKFGVYAAIAEFALERPALLSATLGLTFFWICFVLVRTSGSHEFLGWYLARWSRDSLLANIIGPPLILLVAYSSYRWLNKVHIRKAKD